MTFPCPPMDRGQPPRGQGAARLAMAARLRAPSSAPDGFSLDRRYVPLCAPKVRSPPAHVAPASPWAASSSEAWNSSKRAKLASLS